MALQPAAGSGHLEIVRLLLDKEAHINALAGLRSGLTALQAAASCGHLEIVQLLLDSGAYINAPARENGGLTALEAASGCGHRDIVQLLLDRGADIYAPTTLYSGLTALQAAARCGHLDIVQLLLDKAGNINCLTGDEYLIALNGAVGGGYVDIVELLLKNLTGLNSKRAGKTALQIAVRNESVQIVQLPLPKGADVNAISACKDPPLLIAAQRRNSVRVKLLIDNGANIIGRDMIAAMTKYGYGNFVSPQVKDTPSSDTPSSNISQYSEVWKALKFW